MSRDHSALAIGTKANHRKLLEAVSCWALVVLLAACTVSSVSEDHRFSDKAKTGLLVGSLTYQGKYSGYSIYFRSMDDKRSGWIETGKGIVIIPYIPEGDFERIGLKGDLFAIELPEGKYTVSSWAVSSGYVRTKPYGKFDIGFVINAGKALYIGNFDFIETSSFGLTVTGVEVTYSDQIKRDLALFQNKYRSINSSRFLKGLNDGLVVYHLGGSGQPYWFMPPVTNPVP